MKRAAVLENSPELAYYLCLERIISFDGFVSYEGRRFGVPYWYSGKTCRVKRDGYILEIYADDMSRLLVTHDVTWGRRDSWCKDQFAIAQPEEEPSVPVKVKIQQLDLPEADNGFSHFNFEGIIPENVVKVSKIKCFKPNQQTLFKIGSNSVKSGSIPNAGYKLAPFS